MNEYILTGMDAFCALERVLAASADVLFCGHTHIPYVRTLKPGQPSVRLKQGKDVAERQFTSSLKRIINVGSVGEPKPGILNTTYVIYD